MHIHDVNILCYFWLHLLHTSLQTFLNLLQYLAVTSQYKTLLLPRIIYVQHPMNANNPYCNLMSSVKIMV